MDEDDDDFYGSAGANATNDHEMSGQDERTNIKREDERMSDEEEEDSDDDVQFTLEKPDVVKTETASHTKPVSKAIPVEKSSSQAPIKSKQSDASAATKQESAEHLPQRAELLHNGKEGKDYPEHRTSNVELDDDPVWPADGKKITEVDIDADLAEMSKPWRLPGTDVTDFFNYGFDEYTWTQYCARQRNMSGVITELKEEDAKMKSMLGGDMPNMGEGMPDMNTMMQMMMSMGMPPPGQPPAFGGMGGNNSPLPQAGQGFQPPFGPGAFQNDAFNQQQMMPLDQQPQTAPLQQQQQQYGAQGGGGRGRGRRGRGHY